LKFVARSPRSLARFRCGAAKICLRVSRARLLLGETRDLREITADSILSFLESASGLNRPSYVQRVCREHTSSLLAARFFLNLSGESLVFGTRRVPYICLRLPLPLPLCRVRASDGSGQAPNPRLANFPSSASALRWQWVNQGSSLRRAREPVTAKHRLTFPLRVPIL